MSTDARAPRLRREYDLRRRQFDNKLIVYQYDPSEDRAMQWLIVAVKRANKGRK